MRLFRSTLLLMLAAAVVPSVVLGFVLLREAHATVSLRAAALAGAATLGVALPLSAWFARRLARPVLECVRGALDIARGRFGRQVTVTVRNEIGELAYTFNHMSRQLESYDRENRALIAALEAGYLATLRSLVSAIDAKDPSTRGHSDRVAELAVAVGRELGVDDVELKALAYGGLLHDVGKIGIPEALLHKAAGLAPAVRSHHERWDGTGYPDRLAGEAIPLVARVVNAADTFDACTSVRPYQEAIPAEAALDVLQRLRGTQIDPTVCDALVRVMRRRVPAAQAPELATGST